MEDTEFLFLFFLKWCLMLLRYSSYSNSCIDLSGFRNFSPKIKLNEVPKRNDNVMR